LFGQLICDIKSINRDGGDMQVFSAVDDIRKVRWETPSLSWGIVPTMGFLHEAHLNLVRRAKEENDKVGVSIFVNPIQFNNPNDLATYPKDMARDLDLLEKGGVDLVWTPTPDVVYPEGYQTYVNVEKVTQFLEGASRAGHFQGVSTVVAKLFNVFQPTRAYFGQKDAQQVVVIQRMAKDLNFNLEVVVCPTTREADGLAMSSRNVKLTPGHRKQATCLFAALTAAKTAFDAGEKNVGRLRDMMTAEIKKAPDAVIDYVSVANPETLEEIDTIKEHALLSMAVNFGAVRLIDNMII
jgi:pantoate--beta-alanine ligase